MPRKIEVGVHIRDSLEPRLASPLIRGSVLCLRKSPTTRDFGGAREFDDCLSTYCHVEEDLAASANKPGSALKLLILASATYFILKNRELRTENVFSVRASVDLVLLGEKRIRVSCVDEAGVCMYVCKLCFATLVLPRETWGKFQK